MKATLSSVTALIRRGGGRKKGKKGRKIGRYSRHPSSVRYRSERRWETNRLHRVRRHLRRQPGDRQARSWLSTNGGVDGQAFLAALPVGTE